MLLGLLLSCALAPPVSGVDPHLAASYDEAECGIGGAVEWAGRLWPVTYAPHRPLGSSDGLSSIGADLELYADDPGQVRELEWRHDGEGAVRLTLEVEVAGVDAWHAVGARSAGPGDRSTLALPPAYGCRLRADRAARVTLRLRD